MSLSRGNNGQKSLLGTFSHNTGINKKILQRLESSALFYEICLESNIPNKSR